MTISVKVPSYLQEESYPCHHTHPLYSFFPAGASLWNSKYSTFPFTLTACKGM